MDRENLILLTLDEVRPDHLSCYGYKRIETKNIDRISKDGVQFETCISASCYTPTSHAAMLSGVYPNKTGVRGPYGYVQSKTLAQILKQNGYDTAGFVGVGVLSARHGFAQGFDTFDEPKPNEESFQRLTFPDSDEEFILGSLWLDRMRTWLDEHYEKNFFIWGHYLHCHSGAERQLLSEGKIKEGVMPEFQYYDAKIKYMDETLIGPILEKLENLNLYDKTTIAIMSDHGTNLGEHLADPIPWRGFRYPQHMSTYDEDLRVIFLLKSSQLPKGKKIKGMVRSIDFVPTILDLFGIACKEQFDGITLRPFIEKGEASNLMVYAEDLFEVLGAGAIQGIRTDEYKFSRNLTKNVEELYNLKIDPKEQANLLCYSNLRGWLTEKELALLVEWRKFMNAMLWKTAVKTVDLEFSEEDKEHIDNRLRALGYIE